MHSLIPIPTLEVFPAKPKARTQIYILCRDRPEFAKEAVRSAIKQDVDDVEVIVSDNSEHDIVGDMVAKVFPGVTYIRRRPALQPLQHFRVVIEDSTAEHVVMFHDDDVLYSNYVRTMRTTLDSHPDIVAVGCNARILRGTSLTDRLFMTRAVHDVVLKNAEELLDFYMRFNSHRPAPFPGYMYRKTAIDGLYLDAQNGGKHADVTFLMNVIGRGNLYWVSSPLMQYRMHGTNDSSIENVGQRLRLLRYIYRYTSILPKSDAVQEFRFRYWVRWWRLTSKHGDVRRYHWRKHIIFTYLWRQALRFALTKSGLWVRVISGAWH
jgi:hypothetical protein